ncbi:MAG: bifunctional metallophosphatase/5'-nucleotidase [Dehalococcoidia bacterium]|nr:bifunctional metallophosphatase/5'-nucleotidase [Dehalococcoidia bacterium]
MGGVVWSKDLCGKSGTTVAGNLWFCVFAIVAFLLTAGCGSNQDSNASRSIQQEVQALKTELAQSEMRRIESLEELYASVEDLSEKISTLTESNAALRQEVRALSSEIEAAQIQEEASTGGTDANADVAVSAPEKRFTLQLLHASDMDNSVGALDNVENFSAILEGFRAQFQNNTLIVSSGDNYIPGPRYYAAGDGLTAEALGISANGRGDIALLNAMGFQASSVGNHELDHGTRNFANIIGSEIDEDGIYLGATFPYLSSNLVFSNDSNLEGLVVPDGQEAALVAGSLAGSAVVTVGGERIGLVGATTPTLTSITASGDIIVEPADADDTDQLARVIQASVDVLADQGIDKIVLLAHMQLIEIEKELASKLNDVDIIVSGGSNTLLADETDRLRAGDESKGDYPLRYTSPDGEPVMLVNVDGDYKYLGRLVLDFDSQGRIIEDSINPFVSGAYATDPQGAQAFSGRPIPEVTLIKEYLRAVLRSRDGNIIGKTEVYLAGARNDARSQETNLGNLSADANLWLAQLLDPEVLVSLKNGGGIRDDIGEAFQPPGTTDPADMMFTPPAANPSIGKEAGDISQFDVEGALRFNNGLVIIPLTAEELVGIMEHGIGFEGAGDTGRTDGRFPQVGGMRFSFDPSGPSGDRIRSLTIVDDDGAVTDRVVENGALVGDPNRQIKMVTLNFLANGGDGYPFPPTQEGRIDLSGEANQFNPPNPDFPDTNGNGKIDGPNSPDPGLSDFSNAGGEQDALAEYLAHRYASIPFDRAETPASEDRRVQNLGIPGKRDTVFE